MFSFLYKTYFQCRDLRHFYISVSSSVMLQVFYLTVVTSIRNLICRQKHGGWLDVFEDGDEK